MPEKTCVCGQKSHVRVKICPSCNKVFEKKEKTAKIDNKISTDITIGAWAKDIPKGMPKIEEPEPLKNVRLSVSEIRNIISEEGLGYAIIEYVDPKKITDDILRGMWTIAKKQLMEIKMYVYK